MRTILAFGNPVYDEIRTPRVATPGRVLSGCSTNACLALSRLGHQAELVGRVGADFQLQFVTDMERFGVRAWMEPASQTGGFRLIYDQRGDRTLDVLGLADPITHVPSAITEADLIVIGPILQETPLGLWQAIRAQTHAPIFLDPQGMLRRIAADGRIEHYVPADFAEVASWCRVIKANEVEAHVLTGIDPRRDVAAAARALRALGCTIAIVTLAEAGSFIDDGQRQLLIPAYPTDARDPTGAGDTYMAGFIHAYLENPDDLYRAGCMGAAVASLWIEDTGPEVALPLAEVLRRWEWLVARRRDEASG
ncbi:PfkB family carbohydrate kinase [Candidatus Oscillochloris fontis]|uniref:PfkB family carbohydrate kinase n=1 Tax=Candidatus Oscillochloris fontis TaxID=2496868 RepID=UPI00101D8218|nr:PfkB family carbohydrate kinase [Candidatus Oscillochloris fontis]